MERLGQASRQSPHTADKSNFDDLPISEIAFQSLKGLFVIVSGAFGHGDGPFNGGLLFWRKRFRCGPIGPFDRVDLIPGQAYGASEPHIMTSAVAAVIENGRLDNHELQYFQKLWVSLEIAEADSRIYQLPCLDQNRRMGQHLEKSRHCSPFLDTLVIEGLQLLAKFVRNAARFNSGDAGFWIRHHLWRNAPRLG